MQKLYKTATVAGVNLEYYMMEDEETVEGRQIKMYGIEVRKKNKEAEEISQVKSIFTDKHSIEKLIGLLVRNTVTPIALKDIVEDFVVIMGDLYMPEYSVKSRTAS